MGKYLEIKWYGRGGQGVMTAATVLAEVLAMEGKYVQACPDFSNGKSCVSVQAFNRLADAPLKLHSVVDIPDIVVIMDIVLFIKEHNGIKPNAKENAIYIVNTSAAPEVVKGKLGILDNTLYTMDADSIGCCETGSRETMPNIALMTVLIYCLAWISMETFKQRLRQSLSQWLPPDQVAANLKSVDSVEQGLKEAEQAAEKNL